MPKRPNQRRSERTYHLIPTTIRLKGRDIPVNDISNEGIGIRLEAGGPSFTVGERLEDIPMPLQGGTVRMKGVVSHVSVDGATTVCGIRFLFSGDDFDAAIRFRRERTRQGIVPDPEEKRASPKQR